MKNNKKKTTKNTVQSNRRLSPFRILIALTFILAVIYLTTLGWDRVKEIEQNEQLDYEPWFASYVDVTARPVYAFEQLGSTETPNVVLSFIVSSKQDPCIPTWGAYYNMDEAFKELDLDRRIARLQQKGGNVAISFGGLLNDELAVKCQDPDKLLSAYKQVIERYKIDTIDLDLESSSMGDSEANIRRAKVIAKLQSERRSEGNSLAVWLTVPVAPSGLTINGTSIVSEMLSNDVDLAGVNVMTMDYGESKGSMDMFEASKSALLETHRQLSILYKLVENEQSAFIIWQKLGATPMIGQNDVEDEVFSLENAKSFNEFAITQNLGRMSMWSANRDLPCGENYVDTKSVSDSCSGVNSEKLSYSVTLSQGFDGDPAQNAKIFTPEASTSDTPVVDNPETSPYQIWSETGAYPRGVKVVWRGNVYEAKWWTKGETPDNPVLQSFETPWRLIGPVLEGEKPIEQITLPENTYPEWSGLEVYDKGDRVLFEGTPFEAKWWTQGDSPAASAANTESSPWLALTQLEIIEILKELEDGEEN